MKWFDPRPLLHLLRRIGASLLDGRRWRDAFLRNPLLKIASLVAAFGLWTFVNFGERNTEETLQLPIEIVNLPEGLMVTGNGHESVDVRVVGPRPLLGRVDRTRLSLPVDLGGAKAGAAVFRITTDSLTLPRGVRVLFVQPTQLTLQLEKVAEKLVPVQLRLLGKLPSDFLVVSQKVAPDHVEVRGPAALLGKVEAALTQSIDLAKLAEGTVTRQLSLEPPGEHLSFGARRVTATLQIAEVIETREIRDVAVQLEGATLEASVSPNRLRLKIRGPKKLVADYASRQESLVVVIDASGEAPTERSVAPVLELPEGLELLSMEPASVRLTLTAPTPRPEPKP